MAALRGKTMLNNMLRLYVLPRAWKQTLRNSVRAMSTQSFKCDDLQVEVCKHPQPKPDSENLVFGKEFSDHMLEVRWRSDTGWGSPQIRPVGPISMHPAAKVLHYSVELFEGMKAYRGVDNKIRLFRPEHNMARMLNTADRSSLPLFDGEELLKCMKKLISVDREWVPYSTSCSLYIRPTLIGTEPSLGVNTSTEALLFVLTGPVGPYFPTGFKPVTLLADPKYVRAWKGGCGGYKMGSNYGPTIAIQQEAIKQGCQQVLWLYGEDHQLTEVGTMNIFMWWINEQGEKELVTPPLDDGIILPGVTRGSLVDLAIEWGEFKMTERRFTMKDVLTGLKENRIKEIFGAGTACCVCPVERILYEGEMLEIPTMEDGAPMTSRFLKELTDMQYGRKESNWTVEIEEEPEAIKMTAA